MSLTEAQGTRDSGGSGMMLIAGGAILLLGALWLFSGNSDARLQRSATGFDGIVKWLKANDIEARSFKGGAPLVEGKVGLRILPLHDTDLENSRERPTTRAEVIAETSENDIDIYTVNEKLQAAPTLLILPKWRSGMRRLGVAHRELLIPEQEMNRLLGQIGFDKPRMRRDPGGYASGDDALEGDNFAIGLMHEQTFAPTECEPLIGTRKAMLLGACKIGKVGTFWLLTDPDLMNNHGLALSQNADAALSIARMFDLSLPVIVDYTNEFHMIDEDWLADREERTWEDFLRMFEWPFTMIWIGFFFVSALVLWRAATRYGPLARLYDDEPRASKEISINAKARLLRLSRHDAALMRAHIKARLAHLAADLLGPHRPSGQDPLDVLEKLIGRRSAELATELRAASDLPEDTDNVPGELLRRLDRFETCYDRVSHEFGRATGPRG